MNLIHKSNGRQDANISSLSAYIINQVNYSTIKWRKHAKISSFYAYISNQVKAPSN